MFGNSVMLQCDNSNNFMFNGMFVFEVKLVGDMLLSDRLRENKDLRGDKNVKLIGLFVFREERSRRMRLVSFEIGFRIFFLKWLFLRNRIWSLDELDEFGILKDFARLFSRRLRYFKEGIVSREEGMVSVK